jgi:GntR family transcriptional regulator/MocR family aminotransferase
LHGAAPPLSARSLKLKGNTKDSLIPLWIDDNSPDPAYLQLYTQIREAILSGRLLAGRRIPSSRQLARELTCSRNTIVAAFEQLLSEGYVQGSIGSGTYVADVLPEESLKAVLGGHAIENAKTPLPVLSKRGLNLAKNNPYERPPGVAFAPSQPDVTLFPFDIWGKLLANSWRSPNHKLVNLADPRGYYPLRHCIAEYLRSWRALSCTAEQIVITSGAQHSHDLLARLLLDPGDVAWTEEPGYLGIRSALVSCGARVASIPMDNEGISVRAGRKTAPNARLAAVAPSHQYPLGVVMSLSRRLELLQWAVQNSAWVVEDDYDSEFRYTGRPLAALQGLDQSQRVVYVGTFSKVMFPSLRLGYIVVPERLVDTFVRARSTTDNYTSAIAQAALAEFIEQGHFATHIRKMRQTYLQRRNMLCDIISKKLAGALAVEAPEAGLHVVAQLSTSLEKIGDHAIATAASRAGLVLSPLSHYFAGKPTRQGLLMGFACTSEQEIAKGVDRLSRVLEVVRAQHGAVTPVT